MFEKLTSKAKDKLFLNSGVYVEGNKEIIIENCNRIEEYNEVFIQLVSGNLVIQIWGNDLRSYDFNTGGLIIKGKISRIDFTERGKKRESKALHEDKCEGKADI